MVDTHIFSFFYNVFKRLFPQGVSEAVIVWSRVNSVPVHKIVDLSKPQVPDISDVIQPLYLMPTYMLHLASLCFFHEDLQREHDM